MRLLKLINIKLINMSAEIEKKDIVTDEQAKEAANKAYELMVVDKVHSMCEESLSPELFEMWLKVKSSLQFTRNVE